MAEPRPDGIESKAHAREVPAGAVGAGGRSRAHGGLDGGPGGHGGPGSVEVTGREPERVLAWSTPGNGPAADGSRSSSPRRASGPRSRSPPSTRGRIRTAPTLCWSSSSMSSDPQSGAPSSAADPAAGGAAGLGGGGPGSRRDPARRARGHLPGSRGHAEGPPPTPSRWPSSSDPSATRRARAGDRRLHEVGMIYVPPRSSPAAPDERGAEGSDADRRSSRHMERSSPSAPAFRRRSATGSAPPPSASTAAGTGGLAGERIPLEARIVRVACACDGRCTTPGEARARPDRGRRFEVLRAAAGRELDPRVVEALAGMLDASPAAETL